MSTVAISLDGACRLKTCTMGTPSSSTSPIRRHALYYPFVRVRQDDWLQAAALYWKRMYVMVPDGYPAVEQSQFGQELKEVGFLRYVDSRPAVAAVAPRFLDLLGRHDTALRAVYQITEDDRRQ
jgi:hypothetical protein